MTGGRKNLEGPQVLVQNNIMKDRCTKPPLNLNKFFVVWRTNRSLQSKCSNVNISSNSITTRGLISHLCSSCWLSCLQGWRQGKGLTTHSKSTKQLWLDPPVIISKVCSRVTTQKGKHKIETSLHDKTSSHGWLCWMGFWRLKKAPTREGLHTGPAAWRVSLFASSITL